MPEQILRLSSRITELDITDRPRDRLAQLGAQALSNAEIIAILLRSGLPGENAVQIGQRLLNTYNGLWGLYRASFDEIAGQRGIGQAKAAQVMAALDLGRRLAVEAPRDRTTINSPADAATLVQYDMSVLEQEHLRVLLLDTRNHLMDIVEVYKGSVNSSQVHVGEIFKAAVRRNAPSIIVAHNHPSGDPTPSPDDVAVTRALSPSRKASRCGST